MLEHSAINSHTLCVGLGFSLHECKEADAEKLANLPRVIQQQVAQLSLGPPWCPRVSGAHCHFICVCKVNVNQISPLKKNALVPVSPLCWVKSHLIILPFLKSAAAGRVRGAADGK